MTENIHKHERITQVDDLVTKVLGDIGKEIVLGIPLGAGKPNQFVNALYQRVKSDTSLNLTIVTALSLVKPTGRSLLEKNFLEPLVDRLFADYPDLDFVLDRQRNKTPANIRIIEFYLPAGSLANNQHAQQNYISTNYTHVARDAVDLGVNVVAQLVHPNEEGTHVSLGCNPDVTIDMFHVARKLGRKVITVGQTNRKMPYTFGDAVVSVNEFDYLLENPELEYELFAPPKQSIPDTDYMIGLYASSLIKDDGELQIGIGALGDALVYSLCLRQSQNNLYNKIIDDMNIRIRYRDFYEKIGETGTFKTGLFSATEMFVDSMMHLIDANIIKKEVYDHVVLQRLLNEGTISESITKDTLYQLIKRQAIYPNLTLADFDFLQKFGIFRAELKFEHNCIVLPSGEKIAADLNNDENQSKIINHCLGDHLKGGAIVHGGFFLGPRDFYDWLHKLDPQIKQKIHMKSVRKINQLYGHEELDRLHRKNARFVNTCLYMTLFGAAVSDGLDNGKVISGVGGQYNFVAMAQELPDGHSILQLRSTRSDKGRLDSNIVFNYGHTTIPRHLRDIVITEYGIAYLRGKTDEEVAKALIEVADSRFQDRLVRQAKKAGKLAKDYRVPQDCQLNSPERNQRFIGRNKNRGLFPPFPFGTDLTEDEIKIGRALKKLKAISTSKAALAKALWAAKDRKIESPEEEKLMARMKLDRPKSLQEKIYQRLVLDRL